MTPSGREVWTAEGSIVWPVDIEVDRAEKRIVCAALNLVSRLRHSNLLLAWREWQELRAACKAFEEAMIEAARVKPQTNGDPCP